MSLFRFRPLWACLLLALTQQAMAQQGQPDRQARVWAASCAACHGNEGRGGPAIPALAGRDAEQLNRTLQEFKTGQRPAATVMHQHAKGYSDEELLRLSRYFASLKPGQPVQSGQSDRQSGGH